VSSEDKRKRCYNETGEQMNVTREVVNGTLWVILIFFSSVKQIFRRLQRF